MPETAVIGWKWRGTKEADTLWRLCAEFDASVRLITILNSGLNANSCVGMIHFRKHRSRGQLPQVALWGLHCRLERDGGTSRRGLNTWQRRGPESGTRPVPVATRQDGV